MRSQKCICPCCSKIPHSLATYKKLIASFDKLFAEFSDPLSNEERPIRAVKDRRSGSFNRRAVGKDSRLWFRKVTSSWPYNVYEYTPSEFYSNGGVMTFKDRRCGPVGRRTHYGRRVK